MRVPLKLKSLMASLLVVAVIAGLTVFSFRLVGVETTQQLIQRSGVLAPIIFIILCALSLIIAPLSGSSLFIIGGILFGKEKSFALSLIATLLGCSINFWISKTYGRRIVQRLVGGDQLDQLDRFIYQLRDHRSIFYIMLLMPISQDVVSYAVGLTQIKFPQFFIALLISSIGVVAAYIYLGTGLVESLIR